MLLIEYKKPEKDIMVFTIKRPTSRRFFQLSFEGFSPRGKNKIEQFFNMWLDFFRYFGKYLLSKFRQILGIFRLLVSFLFSLYPKTKTYIITKLIWSRGKLGRPVATWAVLSFSFMVFMFGEVFSASTLIVDKQVNADYLKTNTDIIPKKEIALTEIPDIRKRTESVLYNVQEGDTLYNIGEKFKTSVDALKYVNNLSDNAVLKIGQELTIPPASGLVHTVESGDSLTSIAKKYDVPVQAIADFNYLLDTKSLAVGSDLVIPGGKVPKVVPPPVIYADSGTIGNATGNAEPNKSYCVWPTTVRIITQYFNWYHNGLDIATPTNGPMPPLLSCAEGTVTRAGWDPFGLGLHVAITHGDGYETIYGHMSRLDVSYGESVSKGQVLGLMGNTGRSTGPHVHFMVKYNGVAQNPLNYMY